MTQKAAGAAAAAGRRRTDESRICRSTGTTSMSPSAVEILDGLLMRYIESQVYQGAVENVACEMAARMVAMKSASDNAGNLIAELATDLQQGAPGGDHQGAGGDRRRRGGGLAKHLQVMRH